MLRIKTLSILGLMFISLLAYSQKTVAILPFTFTDDGHLSIEKGKEAQQYLIQYIQKKQKHFKVKPLNARDVNVKLNKAGITPQTIDNFTTKEISDALGGADYILIGSIDRSMEGASTVNTGFGTTNYNTDNTSSFGSTVNTTTKKYKATAYISIFTSDGTSVFDKSKGNIFIDDTPDSWKNSVLWMVRHFPFYQ